MRVIPKKFKGAIVEQRCVATQTFEGVTLYETGKPRWFYVPTREHECKALQKALNGPDGSVNFLMLHIFDLHTGVDIKLPGHPNKIFGSAAEANPDVVTLRAAATILRHNGDQATARRVMTMVLKLEEGK